MNDLLILHIKTTKINTNKNIIKISFILGLFHFFEVYTR